jgi:hypothetical protein
LLGYADDLEQATAMLREAMDADRYWPDAWFISDHSNLHRLTRGGRLSNGRCEVRRIFPGCSPGRVRSTGAGAVPRRAHNPAMHVPMTYQAGRSAAHLRLAMGHKRRGHVADE